MYVASEEEEGLYNLYFHNCQNYDNFIEPLLVDFTVRLFENDKEIKRLFIDAEEIFLS